MGKERIIIQGKDADLVTPIARDIGCRADGSVYISIGGPGSYATVYAIINDAKPPYLSLSTLSSGLLFNGSTWDRQRNNVNETVLASAARTATTASADFTNYNGRGLHAIIDVTVAPGVDTITPHLQGKDPVSGNYYDLLVGNAIVAVSTVVLKIYPGIIAVLNSSAADILPRTWRLNMVHSAATSFTYSVGASVIL